MPLLAGDAVDTTALAHARGEPPSVRARIRAEPEDFVVHEDCPITLSGEGEHFWCLIEKRGLTTQDAIQAISHAWGVHPRHIGFAGLKDRQAVTRQWISVAWPIAETPPSFDGLGDGLAVQDASRHGRKLKRGAHRGNRFRLRLTGLAGDLEALDADLRRIATDGVPNYFGAQRFGRDGRNIALSRALFAGKRLSRNRRGFALSAARSLLFNAVLDRRVREGSWNRLLDGEAVMLDGSHSIFARSATDEPAERLDQRLAAFDIHSSGPLPGRGDDETVSGEALAIERAVLADFAEFAQGLDKAGIDAARRALRLPVRELDWRFADDRTLELSFWLPPGAFATVVLRELAITTDGPIEREDSRE